MLRRQQAVGVAFAALGLLVDEPAVEPEVFRTREPGNDGKIAGGVLLEEVVEPLDLAAVAGLREEHGAQNRHAVAVGRVDDVRAGRHDQALAGGAAPVYQLVNILPVGKHIGVGRVEAVRRVSAGAGIHDGDGHHIHILVLCGVGGGEQIPVHPPGQGDGADVIGRVCILGRVPGQKVAGDPVGNFGEIGQGLCVGALFRNGQRGLFRLRFHGKGGRNVRLGGDVRGGGGGRVGHVGIASGQTGQHCRPQEQRQCLREKLFHLRGSFPKIDSGSGWLWTGRPPVPCGHPLAAGMDVRPFHPLFIVDAIKYLGRRQVANKQVIV